MMLFILISLLSTLVLLLVSMSSNIVGGLMVGLMCMVVAVILIVESIMCFCLDFESLRGEVGIFVALRRIGCLCF